jgi:hypothetical protein
MSQETIKPRKPGKKKSKSVNPGFTFIAGLLTNPEVWKFLNHLLTIAEKLIQGK